MGVEIHSQRGLPVGGVAQLHLGGDVGEAVLPEQGQVLEDLHRDAARQLVAEREVGVAIVIPEVARVPRGDGRHVDRRAHRQIGLDPALGGVVGLEQGQAQDQVHRQGAGLHLEGPGAPSPAAAATRIEAPAELDRLRADIRVVPEEVESESEEGHAVEEAPDAATPGQRSVERHVLEGAGADAVVVQLEIAVLGEAQPCVEVGEPFGEGGTSAEDDARQDRGHHH